MRAQAIIDKIVECSKWGHFQRIQGGTHVIEEQQAEQANDTQHPERFDTSNIFVCVKTSAPKSAAKSQKSRIPAWAKFNYNEAFYGALREVKRRLVLLNPGQIETAEESAQSFDQDIYYRDYF